MNDLSIPQPRFPAVEDVQGRADARRIPIDRVGIKDLLHPVRVVVPMTSLCPCSKAFSERGAHKRSHVTVTVATRGFVWIEELVERVEAEASSPLYGLLKPSDEKYVTKSAYDHPKFVEDMVRDVAARLDDEPRITAYIVESENFESIRNHSAYALIERNKAQSALS